MPILGPPSLFHGVTRDTVCLTFREASLGQGSQGADCFHFRTRGENAEIPRIETNLVKLATLEAGLRRA